MNRSLLVLAVLSLFFTSSCKDDSTSPGPSDEVPATTRDQIIRDYKTKFLGSQLSDFGWSGNLSNCQSGTLTANVQEKTLMRINYFRELAGLEGNITFRDDWNAKCQEIALMCHANGSLNHSPPSSWKCFTSDGQEAAIRSNLSAQPSTNAIVSYMRDAGSGNYAVGHRRYILASRAKTMGHGATSQYDALWVVGGSASPSSMPEFVAWPPKAVPAPFVWPRWSFSVPGANFSSAMVTVKDDNGNTLSADVVSRTDNFGDPAIVFEPQGIDLKTDNKRYTVSVDNVMVNGASKKYEYSVTIIQVN